MNALTIVLLVIIIFQELQIISLNHRVMILYQQLDALSTIVGQKIYRVFVENNKEENEKETGGD